MNHQLAQDQTGDGTEVVGSVRVVPGSGEDLGRRVVGRRREPGVDAFIQLTGQGGRLVGVIHLEDLSNDRLAFGGAPAVEAPFDCGGEGANANDEVGGGLTHCPLGVRYPSPDVDDAVDEFCRPFSDIQNGESHRRDIDRNVCARNPPQRPWSRIGRAGRHLTPPQIRRRCISVLTAQHEVVRLPRHPPTCALR